MQLIPVLEIRHGKCVHTEVKNNTSSHVVKQDVFELLKKWQQQGIRRIHLVDVDAIESGQPENVDLICEIKQNFPEIIIQVIGGIKCIESAYIWMDAGADYLVLNSRAIRQRHLLDDACVEFAGKILVEIDSRDGQVTLSAGEPALSVASLAKQLEQDGVVGLVVTEVAAKGHVGHKKLADISSANQGINLPLFANGAIETIHDLQQLMTSQAKKMSGILIGKPLHNGFNLSQANALLTGQQISA